MGIKDLWNILTPYCERKPLHVLEGQKVGIDLSGWICESQCVVDYFVQPKMYLRNLFFRTAYLLLMDIQPVFILDGEAPQLKHQTIQKRNEIQFIGARPRAAAAPTDNSDNVKSKKKELKGRTRFKYVLKQCSDLLATLGITTIQAIGEAEALCAWLNKLGYLDGIISQDSDCFGYGATTVYRNFSVSKQGKTASQGGSVDIYDMRRIWTSMDLKQNKCVVLALLCGCDYCPGVDGVGKDSVIKLFSMYKDGEILSKIREWRDKNENLTEIELKVDDKSYCNNCGHYGSTQKHSKSGCGSCRTSLGCDGTIWKEKRLIIKAELQVRKKALVQTDFPQEEIIEEFLQEPKLPEEDLNITWKQPNVVKFVKTLSKLLQWPDIYCFQKILPILTRWQLVSLSRNPVTKFTRGNVSPSKIVKKRVLKGVESYEILWEDKNKCFEAIFSEEEIKAFELEHPKEGLDLLWSTVEPKLLVEKAYPTIVEHFLELTSQKKKGSRRKKEVIAGENTPRVRKRAKKAQNSSLNDMSGLLSAITEVEKTKKPRKPKKVLEKGVQSIAKFLQKGALAQSTPQRTPLQVINQGKKREISFAMEIPSDFSDDEDSYHDVINAILGQKPDKSHLDGLRLFYDEPLGSKISSKDDSMLPDFNKKSFKVDLSIYNNNSVDDFLIRSLPYEPPPTRDDLNSSYFFQGVHEDEDFFEKSVQILTTVDLSE